MSEAFQRSLEVAVLEAWEDLLARGRTACLVCDGEMAGTGCADCGSSLG